MRKIIQSILFLVVVLLPSCGDSVDYEYSSHRNFFTFHNETHQNPILASAMNPLSPGVYCIIRCSFVSGRYSFSFENNQGQKSDAPVWFNGIDLRLESWKHVGMNNGLIVGYGNLDNPSPFFAYDLQCPNCFDANVLPQRSCELKMSSDGIAACSSCHRKYNLNTGGNVVAGESGKKLTRYRASSTGPYGVLGVN
ncbi:hypothetical protein [Prevotella fusca]